MRILKLSLFVLFVGVIVGMLYLYFFAGFKEYVQAKKYFSNSFENEEKKYNMYSYYYGLNGDAYGGVIAKSFIDGIFVWGITGLRYFKFNKDEAYVVVFDCNRLGIQKRSTRFEIFTSVEDWLKYANKGQYVLVSHNNVDINTVSIIPNLNFNEFIYCGSKPAIKI